MNIDFTTITLSASTGNQSFTGLGINMTSGSPFVRFTGGQGTTENTAQSHWSFLEGYATDVSGSETWTHYAFSNDASVDFAGDEQYSGSGSIKIVNSAGTTIMEFTINSWDSDGFTVNKTTASTSIKLMVMYGTATNAKCLVSASQGTTGNEDIVGLGWNPSSNAIVYTTGAATSSDPVTRANDCYFACGVASTNAQFAHGGQISDGSSFSQGSHANSNSSFIYATSFGGSVIYEGAFVNWITDGLRVNWITAPSVNYFGYLVIDDGPSGDRCKAALWTTQAGAGSDSFSTGNILDGLPKLVYLQSDGDSANTLLTRNDSFLSRGFYTSSGQKTISGSYEDGVNPAVAKHRYQNLTTLYVMNVSGGASDVAEITSLKDGGFNINHSSSAGAKFVGVALMGIEDGCTDCVYTDNPNPPNSIKVNGICYGLYRIVPAAGQTLVSDYTNHDSCANCNSGLPGSVDCGGNPDIIMTISGGNWNSTPPGVYRVCPTSYNLTASEETWSYYHPTTDGDYFKLLALTINSAFKFRNSVTTGTTFATGLTGRIQDRLFTSLTANGVTITIQRGNNW